MHALLIMTPSFVRRELNIICWCHTNWLLFGNLWENTSEAYLMYMLSFAYIFAVLFIMDWVLQVATVTRTGNVCGPRGSKAAILLGAFSLLSSLTVLVVFFSSSHCLLSFDLPEFEATWVSSVFGVRVQGSDPDLRASSLRGSGKPPLRTRAR